MSCAPTSFICDTASGDDRAALGLAGLAVKSGARSTIATLWPVKDKAAQMLMTRFYDQLRKPKITKAE
ncbi:MAG: CHAT domain-containing protein, partial [Flavihumibacter sp.]|nr:CHAT domain-containing protein [Flavihumibacter sp.]